MIEAYIMPSPHLVDSNIEVGDIIVNTECIECDACGAPNAQKCCSRCRHFYYCGTECYSYMRHDRSERCDYLNERREEWANRHVLLPDNLKLAMAGEEQVVEGPCGICKKEKITNPVVLECNDAFCYKCIGKYDFDNYGEPCPCCGHDRPAMDDWATDRAEAYLTLAARSNDGSDEQVQCGRLAYDELIAVSEVNYGVMMNMYWHVMKILALSFARRHEETLKAVNELVIANSTCPPHRRVSPSDMFGVYLNQAEALFALQRWEQADDVFSYIYETGQDENYDAFMKALMGKNKCAYELGNYDKAIEAGSVCIGPEIMRYRPGSHQYVALAQKAKGDLDGARRTMTRAIFYEEPWNKDNFEQNKQLLKELQSLDPEDFKQCQDRHAATGVSKGKKKKKKGKKKRK